MTFVWTEEAIDRLVNGREAGETSQRIAEILGTTRMSVTHKIRRLNLPTIPRSVAAATAARTRWGIPKPPFAKPKAAPKHVPGYLPLPAGCQPVGLLERADDGCCFPVSRGDNQHLFCNAPSPQHGNSHYCDYHWRAMLRVDE